MSSIGLLQRLRERAFSSGTPDEEQQSKNKVNTNRRTLSFDLFAHLSYMSAVATAGVSRSQLFEYAAELPYVSAIYFKNVNLAARKLNLDYAEACRSEAERAGEPEVSSLLLRLAGSLASGEDESLFLRREAENVGEAYANTYAREVEALKKWTDAYVALVVAASLIVIVAVISMMIYPVGVMFIVGLAMAMVAVACVGAWVIYVSAPREIKTRVSGPSSSLQRKADRLFKILVPGAVIAGSAIMLITGDLAWVLMSAAILIFPPGLLANLDDKRINRKDMDLATMVRVLGGVTSAMGTTVSDALGRIDRRTMGSLLPEVNRLRMRMKAGIDPTMCWEALVDETGSEVIDRTVHMFWDSIDVGGEPGKVGESAAFFSSRIAFLRATRDMMASTFSWLAVPLHISLIALMEFIPVIMGLFSLESISELGTEYGESGSVLSETSLVVSDLFTFGQINLELVNVLVTSVVLTLTFSNAFAPKAAAGGHNFKFLFNLSILMIITSALMLLVPSMAGNLFDSIAENPG